jgi:hypothetical protein
MPSYRDSRGLVWNFNVAAASPQEMLRANRQKNKEIPCIKTYQYCVRTIWLSSENECRVNVGYFTLRVDSRTISSGTIRRWML